MATDEQHQGEGTDEHIGSKRKHSLMLNVLSELSSIATPAFVLAVIGLLVVGVVAAFGGWKRATAEAADDTPVAAADTAVEADPLSVSIHSAFWADEVPTVLYAEEGFRYLIVKATLTNTSELPLHATTFQDQFTIDVDGLKSTELEGGLQTMPPTNHRLVDALRQPTLQPGLDTRMILVWQQKAAEPLPSELKVTIHSMTFRESSFGTGTSWRDPEPAHVVTVPVEEFPRNE